VTTDVNVQWIECARKRAFASRKIAKGHATALRHRTGRELGVYNCRHCGLWHLFSEAKREKRRERQKVAA
jgi:hypothetical protein